MTLTLGINDDEPFDCDGCGLPIAAREPYLTGIESCCHGGCYRTLCVRCVREAGRLLAAHEQANQAGTATRRS